MPEFWNTYKTVHWIWNVWKTGQLFLKIKCAPTLNRWVFFARAVSSCQKWWPSLLGREISCSQWEGPSMHSRCLAFFSFYVLGRGGGGERFFSFFPASQCVRTMFLSSSQWVPNIFPNIFSIPPHFYPICLGKWCPPFTYTRLCHSIE